MIIPNHYTNNFLGLGRAGGLVLDWTELNWTGVDLDWALNRYPGVFEDQMR